MFAGQKLFEYEQGTQHNFKQAGQHQPKHNFKSAGQPKQAGQHEPTGQYKQAGQPKQAGQHQSKQLDIQQHEQKISGF